MSINKFRLPAGLLCLVLGLCAGRALSATETPEAQTQSAAGAPVLPPGPRIKVTALRQTVLSSQMSGHIALLEARDGDAFTKGQPLVRLDCAVPTAQLRRAEASVQKAVALYNTTKKLAALNSRSQLELAVARAEADQAAAEATVARIMVERCTVAAPFAGRVSERLVQQSQFVNEGQPLLEILDPTDLELEFIVPSLWLPWFTPGYEFQVRIDETQSTHRARLVRLSGKVDAVSQSIKAYAVFADKDARPLPGMSGEALVTPPDQRGK